MTKREVELQTLFDVLGRALKQYGNIPVYLNDGEYGYRKLIVVHRTTTRYEKLPELDYSHLTLEYDNTVGNISPLFNEEE